MTVIFIENDMLRVGVAAAYGARVVSLFDKVSQREWMTAGGESTNIGEEARYSVHEAVGWDECFPTVSRWDAAATPWGRNLRDHGDLWGRPWQVDSHTATALSTTYSDAQFRFTRTITLEGARLVVAYAAENRTEAPLPYLWALHALLAVQPGDKIELGELESLWSVFMSSKGAPQETGALSWVTPSAGLPFALDEVQPPSADFMAKLYSAHRPGGWARIGRPGARLAIGWDGSIAHLGIWITYGGWPARGGHYEVALEPTNAPADHLGQTIAAGYPLILPFERRDWTVTLTTENQANSPARTLL